MCRKPVAVQATRLWGHILQRNIYIDIFFLISIPDFSLHRLILIIWGIITIVVGAFIFGQTTTIAVMELVHQFWMFTPACSSCFTVTSEQSETLGSFAQLKVAFLKKKLFLVVFSSTLCIQDICENAKIFLCVMLTGCKDTRSIIRF